MKDRTAVRNILYYTLCEVLDKLSKIGVLSLPFPIIEETTMYLILKKISRRNREFVETDFKLTWVIREIFFSLEG